MGVGEGYEWQGDDVVIDGPFNNTGPRTIEVIKVRLGLEFIILGSVSKREVAVLQPNRLVH